jgi:surfactin synthase thioesterase subunit
MTATAHPWWIVPRPRPGAVARVLCIPHAGSGASPYVAWGRRLPEDVELRIVAPPGREHRSDEAPVTDLLRYVEGLADAVRQEAGTPWVLFGHSFGAVVGYELARRLTESGHPPAHLVVSARGFPSDLPADDPMHVLADRELVALMRSEYGGFPAEVDEYPELLDAVLGSLRHDLAMLETFQPRFHPLLPTPVSVFWSPEDLSSTPEEIFAWRQVARGPVSFEAFPGGHFYLFQRGSDVVSRLADRALQAVRTVRVTGTPGGRTA